LLLAAVVLPGALIAGVLGRSVRVAIAVSLPIAVSVALVSVFLRPGATVLFAIGPFEATLEGVDIAAQLLLRLFVMAMALAVFGLTTPPRALVADLERRGVSPRLTFAVAATLETVPAMVERARTIHAAQRSRALDTEGSIGARLRGVIPLIAPVLLTSLGEVEERSLALDARAFGRPGLREPLWTPSDRGWERVLRWLLVVGLVAVLVARAAGAIPALP
jgi:energy-coupling factor transport system permease protein